MLHSKLHNKYLYNKNAKIQWIFRKICFWNSSKDLVQTNRVQCNHWILCISYVSHTSKRTHHAKSRRNFGRSLNELVHFFLNDSHQYMRTSQTCLSPIYTVSKIVFGKQVKKKRQKFTFQYIKKEIRLLSGSNYF